MKEKMLRMLNQQNTLDNMVPLAAFSDEAKTEELGKLGYIPYYTLDGWREAFPDINPMYVLCPKMILFPPSLIYYDPEHYICFDTHIFGGAAQFVLHQGNGREMDANRIIKERIAKGMKDYDEKNYLDLLLPMTSEECGGIAIRILRDMLEHEDPTPNLYEAFLSVYTLCNCGAHLLGEKALKHLVMCKSEDQKAETKRKLKRFLGEMVTVYRGEASQSTPCENACSWTTDINKAYFFASWRSAEDSRILTGNVRKEDIIEYIDDRNEREILVMPGKVELTQKQQCISWESFQDIVSADMFSKRYRFPSGALARNIMMELDAVYSTSGANDHDKNHSFRVALLANYIFRVDILLPLHYGRREEYQAACYLLEDLSHAIVYHDAGRNDNTANTEHGALGYDKFLLTHGENKIIHFFTTFHCRPDTEARGFWEKTFGKETEEFIWRAFCIMKDADALDRVRFGNLSRDYLDVNTLRTETAKRLVPVAHQLYNAKIR